MTSAGNRWPLSRRAEPAEAKVFLSGDWLAIDYLAQFDRPIVDSPGRAGRECNLLISSKLTTRSPKRLSFAIIGAAHDADLLPKIPPAGEHNGALPLARPAVSGARATTCWSLCRRPPAGSKAAEWPSWRPNSLSLLSLEPPPDELAAGEGPRGSRGSFFIASQTPVACPRATLE